MSSMRVMSPRVRWFSERMKEKLRKNIHKSDSRGMSVKALFERLQDEVRELEVVIGEGGSPQEQAADTISECADVANFAMMIADRVREWPR